METPGDIYPVDRIAATDARAILDRLAGSDLIERGCVTLISVEAIQERSGARWARRRDDVWGYVERKCAEHLSFQDIRSRITETDYLIAMTTEEGVAAQAISLKILEEVLFFFLGAAERVDLKIRAVSGLEGDTILSARLDPARLARPRAGGRTDLGPEADPREVRHRSPISFVTAAGERVRIDFAVEPVVSLRHQVTAALRVQPTVTSVASGAVIHPRCFGGLADEDISFIDAATLRYGALFMPQDVRAQPALILPMSFRTLGGRRGRQALLSLEGVTPDQTRQGALIELIDVDAGTPTGRLLEVVGLVSQLCRGVMARIQPGRDALAPVQGARLQGLTLDLRDRDLDDRRLQAVLGAMALQMRGKAPALISVGLPDGALPAAHAAGFTHACAASEARLAGSRAA